MSGDSAEDLKKNGNHLFQQGRYNDAIEQYSRAIKKNPAMSQYYTNRALCYINLKVWPNAADDARKAAELDKNSVKAFYFWGRAATQLEHYDEAIKLLTKANELAVCQKINFGDEICAQLRLARREKFRREDELRVQQEIELQIYLDQLIEEDLSRRLDLIKAEDGDAQIGGDSVEAEKARLAATAKKVQLNAIFAQVDDRRRRREIPDHLCGKISFELLRDPVITPSGITYDKADIKQHLQRVGHFDPVTRAPLKEDDLIPNLAMKEVVEHFLTENPWAEYEGE